ncbi:arylsulfatase [Streptomyces sp. KM273126]|uniref:arylsulfatase n=2 Tax=Actinomycetes TaxID=1760 RepID=UPI00103B46E0|nr:arylsulfatase [Streptomyces sp. KM273126]MBA2810211.1 arylsulfatase [Streptomyces sp. KM273126]
MEAHVFRGSIGDTVAQSAPWWPDPDEGLPRGPNVLMVVLDDTGWADFGCFGSEIATPTIDALADRGLRYTDFHVTPLCSPTRACLLTGRNHHSVGMRFLADTDTGFPNSRGRVDPDVPMLPEVLRRQGCYGTYLVGKWHLAPRHEVTPVGPHHNWPLGRGFDRFYGFLDGCTDQYTPELFEDNHQVEPPSDDGYHLSSDLADRAIRYLSDHVAYRPGRPFFLQLALGATHAPFQAPREYIDKYLPVFAKGWDRTRADRLRRQIELGVAPEDTELAPRNPGVAPWEDLSDDEQLLYTHLQAAYAGFLEHADAQLGRVITELERLGVLDDTLVLVLSDNGASKEGGQNGAVDTNGPYSGAPQSVAQQLPLLDRIGGRDGPAHYPEGWAMAGNTPFRRYKQYVDLGGVRSPLVVSWPRGIAAHGEVRRQFVHAIDVMPTVLDLIGAPSAADTHGRSISATFGDPAASTRDTQYWEMLGHRALWHRGWKAVTEHVKGTPYAEDTWRLYDTASDFSETHDVAARHPQRLAALQELWWSEARANNVLPLDDRTLVELLRLRSPNGLMGRDRLVLRPGQGHVPFCSMVTGTDRSMKVTATLRGHQSDDEGVLLASGNVQGGYVLYVREGRLTFEHAALGQRVICTADTELPAGDCEAGFALHRRDDRSARLVLLHGAEPVGKAEIPLTLPHLAFWGMDVGRDPVSQVSAGYTGDFPFPPHVIDHVSITFTSESPLSEVAEAMESKE